MLQIKELIFKILAEVNDNIYNLIDIAIAYINPAYELGSLIL